MRSGSTSGSAAAPQKGMIPLEDTRDDIVSLIEDVVTRPTMLPIAVREHYQKRHPETRDTAIEWAGPQALVDPGRAMVDTKYPNTVNVFRSVSDTDDVMVSLEVATHPQRSNRVKSLRTHPKARTEELWNNTVRAGKKWPEGGSATPAGVDGPKPRSLVVHRKFLHH